MKSEKKNENKNENENESEICINMVILYSNCQCD